MNELLSSPHEIESESIRRIEEIVGEHGFSDEVWSVVRRMIHTSADLDYLNTVRFHPEAIHSGVAAFLARRTVVTDTRMLLAGISTGRLKKLSVEALCFVDDPYVTQEARRRGITRSAAAVDRALPYLDGGIAAIGNAPTALFRLLEHLKKGTVHPALIVGFPVGFVAAAESKDALLLADCAYITAVGRKGGSAVAASVINALAIMALKES